MTKALQVDSKWLPFSKGTKRYLSTNIPLLFNFIGKNYYHGVNKEGYHQVSTVTVMVSKDRKRIGVHRIYPTENHVVMVIGFPDTPTFYRSVGINKSLLYTGLDCINREFNRTPEDIFNIGIINLTNPEGHKSELGIVQICIPEDNTPYELVNSKPTDFQWMTVNEIRQIRTDPVSQLIFQLVVDNL